MARKDICIPSIAEQYDLTENEIAELADIIEKGKRKYGNNDAKLKAYVKKMIDNKKLAAVFLKKQIAVDISKREALYNNVINRAEAGNMSYDKAVLEVFEGSQRQHHDARVSIDSTRKSIKGNAFSRLFKKLREREGLVKMLRKADDDFEAKIRTELEDGMGKSGDPDARHAAEALRGTTDYLLKRARRAGIPIRELNNYVPHNHDIQRLLTVGKQKWIEDVSKLIDVDKSFPGVDEIELVTILDKMYDNITGRRPIDIETATSMETRVALRHAKHRVLHFNNATASNIYHKMYGKKGGNLLSTYIDYVEGMSRDIAATEFLGVNSKENLKAVLTKLQQELRGEDVPQKVKEKLNPQNVDAPGVFNPIGTAYDIAHGFADVPGNIRGAYIARSLRALANMAKLGRATLASIVDIATTGVNLTYQGVNPFKAYTQIFNEIIQRVTSNREQRQILDAIGIGFDHILGEIAHRYSAGEIGITGKLGALEAHFFKWSGLEGWTDMLRSAGARISANHLGIHAKYTWSELGQVKIGRVKSGKRLQRVLQLYGIDADMWDKIRNASATEADGRKYILPENVADADLADSLMRLYQDESSYFVTMPDAQTRRHLTQGMRPGTIPGEVIRFMGQFKSFPFAVGQKLYGRGIQAFKHGDKMHIAHLIAMMTAMGYVAMTAKDLASGKKPRNPLKTGTWAATFLQSGAGGIYSDFLFAAFNNRGNKFWDTFVGPVPGTAKELLIDNLARGLFVNVPRGEWDRLGARLIREMIENAPYANHFATKAILDYLILNYLLETSNPGALKRRERFLEEHYGQEYFFPPSDYH